MIHEVIGDRLMAAARAADLFIEKSSMNPQAPVGLATGSTMDGVYQHLEQRGFLPESSDAFALDDYKGLAEGSENSYFTELSKNFAARLGWSGRLHVPGHGPYAGSHGLALFEQTHLELGPVSIQLLGIGTNGHIAFNEPGAAFDSITREVELHPQTRQDNARFFADPSQVPTHAYSQGLATINRASSLVLLALGERKKPAVLQALESPGPLTPLAALLDHSDLTLITDFQL